MNIAKMKKKKEIPIEDVMEESLKVFFKKTDKLIEKEWGKKCKAYLWNCCLCRIWDVNERFKKDLELEYLRK
jgi:hypothetical protein